MKTTIINIEGIDIEVESTKADDKDAQHRIMAYEFKYIREMSGMNRVEFANWRGFPYRTM